MDESSRKSVCSNRRARREYHIEDTVEAGLVLQGSEVKSLRAGRANLKDAYARVRDREIYLVKAHIAPYEQANRENHEPERDRKLLLHRREIDRLRVKVRERGYTLVPLELYFRAGRAKVTLALARGKKHYDKREAVAKRDADRRMARVLRRRQRRE
ncbi:MAG: SsrA-binding protein SmpB [Myxococcota bacterium]